MTALVATLAGILGALVGSFGNVVAYRMPRHESIVFPGSHCPHCDRRLGPLELVPVLSFLAQRGRCRGCGAAISWRYPLVEALMAGLFVLLALRYPPLAFGATVIPLLAVWAALVMAGVIDLATFELPDALTLPALAVALAGSLLYAAGSGLPGPVAALVGAAAGAGTLALINRLGALVLRRFADTRERLWPLSLDQVNLAAVAGALGGWRVGLAVGAVSVVVNLLTRRVVRLPEGPTYALWAVALVLSATSFTVPSADALAGSVLAAGAWAVVGATYWWLHDLLRGAAVATAAVPAGAAAHGSGTAVVQGSPQSVPSGITEEDDGEPVAMGFGDVKLAAVLGALLGWENLLVGLFLAVTLGAVAGITVRLAGGDRVIPFGPALLVGGLLALLFGHGIVAWYLGLVGG